MSTRGYLIRLFTSGIENWLKESADANALVKVFELSEPVQSVYEVSDGEQEWLAAAGYTLTNAKHGVKAVSVLRLSGGTLRRFDIRAESGEFGTTGVPDIDRRHQKPALARHMSVTGG